MITRKTIVELLSSDSRPLILPCNKNCNCHRLKLDGTYNRRSGCKICRTAPNCSLQLEVSREKRALYRKSNPVEVHAAHHKWYSKDGNSKKCISSNLLRHRKYKNLLFDLLGGKCVICGITDRRCLQFDHINGGGGNDIRRFKRSTRSFVTFYLKRPQLAKSTLQILCANHNLIKVYEKDEWNAWKLLKV